MRGSHHDSFYDRLPPNDYLIFSHIRFSLRSSPALLRENPKSEIDNKNWLPASASFRSFSLRKRATRRPGNQYSTVDQLSFGLAAVLAIEPFDAAGGVHEFLLAGEERMAV
jgi:hypothetical protein